MKPITACVLFLFLIIPATMAVADAPVVHNGAESARGVTTLELTESWRVGGPEDDETIFGQVVRILGDDRGFTYVLDAQLNQATVFDTDGNAVATLFGQGEGPGELNRASDLVFMPDGTIGAVNRFPGAVVTVESDGTPAGSIRLSVPGRGFQSGDQGRGLLVIAETANLPNEDGTHVVRSILGALDPDGDRTTTYLQQDRHVDYHNNFVFDERQALVEFLYSFDVGPDGRVYALADADRYAVSVFAPDGALERTIEREFDSRRRTDAEMASMKALTERRFRTFPFGISYVFAETEAVVPWYWRGLQVADDGRLWIRHTGDRDLARRHGALAVFDVFTPDGRFDEQVAIPAPGDPGRDGIFLLGADRLVVVHGFVDAMLTMVGGGAGGMDDQGAEPEPIEIVCYRIHRN